MWPVEGNQIADAALGENEFNTPDHVLSSDSWH